MRGGADHRCFLVLCARGVFVVGFALAFQAHVSFGQGSAFTYQGRLQAGDVGANGIYDLRFTLYDAPNGGAQVGNTITNLSTVVTNGFFTSVCDFGGGVFTGPPRWLEIAVRTNAGGVFAGLSPRQPLTAVPYAAFAGGVSAGAVANFNGIATNLTVNGSLSGLGAGLTNRNGFAFADTNQLMSASNSLGGALSNLQRSVSAVNLFNVRAYGATGNGATDDSVAIKAAWDDWVRLGGTLYFPYGGYKDTNTHTMRGAGQMQYKIRGDGQYSSIWLAWNLTGQVFLEAAVDVDGLTFQQGSGSGFNVGFKNMDAAAGMKLNDVRFLNWSGIGWQTDCAGAEGFGLNFTRNTIGLRLAGFADGGTFMGRLAHNFVGVEVGGTDSGSGDGVPQAATHGNMFRFEGPGNVYAYVVGKAACCTIEGYLEGVNNVVSVGYPPEVATLIPGITEVNEYTYSVVVQNLGGFGGTNMPNSNQAAALVAIYTAGCYGITLRNTTFWANTCVLSKTAAADSTPVVLEHAIPGNGPIMTFSDGTTLPTWLPTGLPVTGEINTNRRVYSGTNLLFDFNSAPYLVGKTDPSWLSAPDPDATSFCNRISLKDTTQRTAVSKLVKDLKAAGLWSKWYCLYPFVGASPQSEACNLVSTNYTITWSASPAPVFSALGVTGVTNTPGAYGDTQFNPLVAGVDQDDFSLFVYNLDVSPTFLSPMGFGVFMGVNATYRAGLAHDRWSVRMDGLMSCDSLQGNSAPLSADLRGPLLASRSSSSTSALYADWIPATYRNSSASTGVPNGNIYVLAKNDEGPYMPTGATLAMAGAGHSFSLEDWNRLRAICDNFNALLGRKAP